VRGKKNWKLEKFVAFDIRSPVAAAGCVLDVVSLVERHYIKRDGAQESAIWTARFGFEVGVPAQTH
jgi:hypothetical protein